MGSLPDAGKCSLSIKLLDARANVSPSGLVSFESNDLKSLAPNAKHLAQLILVAREFEPIASVECLPTEQSI